ncbi:aldo/keto reductase [Desulfosporosinus sp. PR]|uniref:aldo/keto reductase n=1 Tax=Candidatus Desulfosporosinus nitrosoreducens TaxID=3401928 RepID=UPI0027E87E24|nr:aldo/keto reductase [Desulfosporosinus sp. PR]MDQ7093608.1 aldo/keto reductase [Desulfosporosinus sp. PR]
MVFQNGLISRFGLGCGRMSNADEAVRNDSMATIQAALDAGVTFLNTADFYGSGRSELVIGEALKGYARDKVFLSVKFGALVAPNGSIYGLDVRPLTVKNYLTYSLKRLNVDYIDLYQPARIDLAIPVEETIGAISDLVKAGYVKHIGMTQVEAETLRKAHSIHPISLVEAEYSLFNRNIEKDSLPTARELGIGVVAFGALAHGMLGGTWTKERIEKSKGGYVPLFFAENIEKNVRLAAKLAEIAAEKQITLSQLAYAWILSKGQDIIPLIGASKRPHFQEAIQSLEISLSERDIKRIEEAIPENEIAGGSFPNMKFKNGVVVQESRD